jgi:hypothetical protein
VSRPLRRRARVRLEQRWAENNGEANPKQLELYGRTTNTLRRTLEAVGLQRRAKDITPSLTEYVRSKQERNEAGAEA